MFTDLDWRKEAPDIVEKAIAICQGVKADSVSDYSALLVELEPEFPYRHDLARVVWHEIYARRTPCWIYFAEVGDEFVKVGRSITVAKRLESLSRQHGVEHKLLGSVRGDYREEGSVHAHFRNHRVKNLEGRHREYYYKEPVRPTIDRILAAGKFIELPWRALP